jgi:hypothetical protein
MSSDGGLIVAGLFQLSPARCDGSLSLVSGANAMCLNAGNLAWKVHDCSACEYRLSLL